MRIATFFRPGARRRFRRNKLQHKRKKRERYDAKRGRGTQEIESGYAKEREKRLLRKTKYDIEHDFKRTRGFYDFCLKFQKNLVLLTRLWHAIRWRNTLHNKTIALSNEMGRLTGKKVNMF